MEKAETSRNEPPSSPKKLNTVDSEVQTQFQTKIKHNYLKFADSVFLERLPQGNKINGGAPLIFQAVDGASRK